MSDTPITRTEAVRALKKIRQDMAFNARELKLETLWARDLAALDMAIKELEGK